MKQATLKEIAESCKVTYHKVYHWAIKAGEKISSIQRKLTAANPRNPAVFNEDEIICIVGSHLEIMGDFTAASFSSNPNHGSFGSEVKNLNESRKDIIQLEKSSKDSGKNYQSPTLDQQLKVVELTVRMAELFEHTTSGASADYCLNWAKKRLSGKNNGDSYTPIMNLLEAPDNKKTTKRGDE